MNRSFSLLRRLAAAISLVATTACGSNDDSGGDGGQSTGARCRLAMTVSGAAMFTSELDDPMSCITAYSLTPGAYVGYGSSNTGDVGSVSLRFPELEPGQVAASIQLPVEIHHVDGTEFDPVGCVADVTENAFSETTDAGDVYRVAGEGSCEAPGVVGDRSISVVGFFRFLAPIRWQN
jgi:hypothetical protein